MSPAALLKMPTQTVDSSKVLAIRIRQPQIIKSITKNWDKNTIKVLDQVCPKHDHNLLSTFWSTKSFIQIDIISVIKHLVLNDQIS